MQNKEIGGEKSVNEKNVEVFNRYFPGCLSVENDNKLTLDAGRLKRGLKPCAWCLLAG
ncbi:hypothetical protein HpHA229_08130 [Helicobacter pylori]